MSSVNSFVKNLFSNTPVNGSSGSQNGNRWLTITNTANVPGTTKSSSFFIIQKFSGTDSKTINSGATQAPSSFVFDNNGNIDVNVGSSKLVFMNPITAPGGLPIDSSKTLTAILAAPSTPNTYKLDPKFFSNQNLKYVIYNKSPSDPYYLLYNPLHRQGFKESYQGIPVTQMNGRGINTAATSTDINLGILFKNYCATMANTSGASDAGYADPSCPCINSPITCQEDAVYNNNLVTYPTIQDATSAGLGAKCVCVAPGCQYSGVNDSESFLTNFKSNNNPCDNFTLNAQQCNMITEANGGNIISTNNKAVQDCKINSNDGSTGTGLDINTASQVSRSNPPAVVPVATGSDGITRPAVPAPGPPVALIAGIGGGALLFIIILIIILKKK